jgi:hypothetical protein
MYVLEGRPLALDRAFTHNGIQYPSRWLRLASPEDRAAIGIEERPEPPAWDQRFYWGYTEDGELIEKDLQQLKEQWVAQTKQTANTLLAPTDWAITRAADPSSQKPVPASVLAERELIRAKSDEKELAIETATTVGELAAYLTSPDYSSWAETIDQEESLGDDGMVFSGSATSGAIGTDTVTFSL